MLEHTGLTFQIIYFVEPTTEVIKDHLMILWVMICLIIF